MSSEWVYDDCTPLDRSVSEHSPFWESAVLQRCIVCLLVFGPCVLACLYLVNVPLRVVCFVRKPAGFVETPNSVQRHPESVTTWGLQVEQGSRGV